MTSYIFYSCFLGEETTTVAYFFGDLISGFSWMENCSLFLLGSTSSFLYIMMTFLTMASLP